MQGTACDFYFAQLYIKAKWATEKKLQCNVNLSLVCDLGSPYNSAASFK